MKNSIRLKKTEQKKLLKELQSAKKNSDVEKSVERAIINFLKAYFDKDESYETVEVEYPLNTDGLIIADGGMFSDSLTILLEVKRDKNFADSKKDVHAVVAQVISYLKKIKEQEPHKYPNVVVIGDNDEIFALPTSALSGYLDGDYNWDLPASSMYKDTSLMEDLAEDKNIRPVINDIDKNFDIVDFCQRLVTLSQESGFEKIKVTKKSMGEAFENFRKILFGTNDPSVIPHNDRFQIEIFSRILFGDEDVYSHPRKKDTLVVDNEEFPGILSQGMEVFSTRYDSNGYSLKEYKAITEMSDSLIEEANRRFGGDFYTPKIWVNKAHEYIVNALGDDWKDKYFVWDPACGTKNLTRDYKFTNLFSSTLYEGELLATKDFNKDNVAFQFDFLNDDMVIHEDDMTPDKILELAKSGELKMPLELVEALYENKPIVFFANPPYGQHGNGTKKEGRKATISNTSVGDLMDDLNKAKWELYTQFIWRTKELAKMFGYTSDFHFFFFFNKTFLTSPNFEKFTEELTSEFTFKDGFMMNAGEFSGTSSAWGIVFSHFEIGGTNQREFNYQVLESNKDMSISDLASWTAHSVKKGEDLSSWFRSLRPSDGKDPDALMTKNGFDEPTSKQRPSVWKNWIGGLHAHSSNVQYSDGYTGMYSMVFGNAGGYTITRDNFTRAAVTFSIRRTVQEDIAEKKLLWVRDKDIFTKPSQSLLTPEFIADCVVYSLFDRQSNQTSLRNYEYDGNTYRVENEFFPFSIQFVEDLAVKHKNRSIESDLVGESERFVYLWLEEHKDDLSPEAQALLDKAQELYEVTFKFRDDFARDEPRYQTNSWDAGYAQIARLAFGNDRINDDFLEFKKDFYALRTKLGNKIAQAAYDDGVI